MKNKNQGCFIASIGGCLLMAFIINLAIGGFLNDYCFNVYFGIEFPMWVDMLMGMFLAEFLMPFAFVAWMITLTTSIAVPFFPVEHAEKVVQIIQSINWV